MYVPSQFREERRDVLVAAMRDIQFAAVVTQAETGLHVTHAPLLVREEAGVVTLEFHVARGNPHWRLAEAPTVAIFQGPQAYIHPGWYESKALHGKVVPTWTYVVVHAHGRLETFEGEALAEHVAALTDHNEEERERPWAVSDAPAKYIDGMVRAIVGLRLKVETLEGSWKLNQHKSEDDRSSVMAGLAQVADADARAIADRMRDLEDRQAAAKRVKG